MKTLELKNGLYWTGVLDRDLRVFDIVMETEFGTTYNSYILKGSEKTALFETAKLKFFDEYIDALQSIVDIKDIDYIVMNHTEPDHAGSIEKLIELNPNIKVVGTACAIGFLKNIINKDFYSIAVKENDTLSLGDKTLSFMLLPNLHWPDSMYTYVKEDKVLFTCDSFGSHYSFDDILLSKVTDNDGYERALKYYFDNIIGPFKPFMLKALNRINDLDVDMICVGHGPVLDCRIDEIKETYRKWCTVVNPNAKKTVVMPYVSAYGYTKELGEAIAKGVKDSGDIDVKAYDMVTADQNEVLTELGYADGILLGSPTIVGAALKPIWDLTTSIFGVTHGGKVAAAFGSYGWSGEAVPHLTERLKQLKMKVLDGFRVRFKPSETELQEAYEYGYNFGCVLLKKENPRKSGARQLVKCVVCGAIFDSSKDICPVCGVGRENFIEVDAEDITYTNNTDEKFLIIGNGIAGLSAAEAIRARNKTCSIVMVTNEEYLTYNRPMLTKSLLAGFTADQIAVYDKKWYEENNINVVTGKAVEKIDTKNKEVIANGNFALKYDKLIYACGADCFIPPIAGADKENVIAIRRLSDANKVQDMLKDIKNVVVIGGGVLGLEAAWEISKSKTKVTVVEIADRIMPRQLDEKASEILLSKIEKVGIDVKLGASIECIEGSDKATGVKLATGEVIDADLVIVSSGVRASVNVAKEAGIEVDRAIVVDSQMRTNVEDIYACGDCAQFEGVNYAVWSEALEMGKVAGAVATGDEAEYSNITPSLSFNGMDTSVFSIGDNGSNKNLRYKTAEFNDAVKGSYEKYYFVNNRICGGILIGDTKALVKLTEAIEKGLSFAEFFS